MGWVMRVGKRGESSGKNIERGVSFFALRLKGVWAVRAWEGSWWYCRLTEVSGSEECVMGCLLMCEDICGGIEGRGRLGEVEAFSVLKWEEGRGDCR